MSSAPVRPVLGLDTSTGTRVALVTSDTVHLAQSTDPRGHAESAAPLVADVLARAGLQARDLAGIAVGTGPAPYTGLRVGLITARELGEATGVAVWGVPTLDVWAAAWFAGAPGTRDERRVRIVTDARRREVYTASFASAGAGGGDVRDVERLTGPEVLPPANVPGDLPLVGPGTERYPEELPGTDGAPEELDVAMLARLGAARAARGADVALTPLYLRRPDVSVAPPRTPIALTPPA